MGTNREIIEVKVTGSKKAKKQLGGVNSTLTSMAKRVGLAAGAYFGAQGLINGFKSLVTEGSKIQQVSNAFKNMSVQSGLTTSALQKFRQATNNTVDDVTLMTKANNAMALGLVQSDEQFADLLDTAQRLGAALGQDVTQSLDSLVTGMGRQSKLMLDNLGIMVDTNFAYEKYALSIGKSTSELDDNEKKIAFNTEAMFQAKKIVGEMGAETETAAMKMASIRVEFQNMTADLGDALSPALLRLTEIVGVAGQKFADFMREQTEDETQTAIRNLKEMGANTTELELSYVRLKKNTAMTDLNIGVMELMNNTNAIADANKEILGVEIEKANTAQRLADIQLQVAELYGEDVDLLIHRGNIEGEAIISGDYRKLQQMDFIIGQKEILDNEIIAHDAKLTQFEDEVTMRTELEEFKIRELALEGQINDQRVSNNKAEAVETKTKTKEEEEEAKKKAKIQAKLDKFILNGKDNIKAKVKELGNEERIKNVREGLQTAYGIAGKSFEWGSEKGGPILGAVLGALGLVGGLAYAAKINSAQYGADFVTSGPQLLQVGEGSGPERVQVTPLVDENINGPQGGNITLNVSGNVMTEEFTEEVIIPQIKEGLRLGNDMGV